jgi:hypothetical protein
VISDTLEAMNPLEALEERGAKLGMKKCSRGKGTMFTASLRRSALSCPGKRRHVVTPDIAIDTEGDRASRGVS